MATEALLNWCRLNAGDMPVVLAAGAAPLPGGDRIELRLLAVAEATSLRDLGARPHRLALTYQLRVECADTAAGHARLCELMFAALETPVLTVPSGEGGPEQLPLAVISGPIALARYGAIADPACLYLDLTIERARPGRRAGVVREPPVLKTSQKAKRIN